MIFGIQFAYTFLNIVREDFKEDEKAINFTVLYPIFVYCVR